MLKLNARQCDVFPISSGPWIITKLIISDNVEKKLTAPSLNGFAKYD